MRHYNLVSHTGGPAAARYFMGHDGQPLRRITKAKYDHVRNAAIRLDCFLTSAKTFRRINRSVAILSHSGE